MTKAVLIIPIEANRKILLFIASLLSFEDMGSKVAQMNISLLLFFLPSPFPHLPLSIV
jgi:hypothetical protein